MSSCSLPCREADIRTFFAEERWKVETQVEIARRSFHAQTDLDPAVLGKALFRNVELRHDLQSRDERRRGREAAGP